MQDMTNNTFTQSTNTHVAGRLNQQCKSTMQRLTLKSQHTVRPNMRLSTHAPYLFWYAPCNMCNSTQTLIHLSVFSLYWFVVLLCCSNVFCCECKALVRGQSWIYKPTAVILICVALQDRPHKSRSTETASQE